MAKFEFYFHAGCRCSEEWKLVEIPDEELEGKTDKEMADIVTNSYNEWVWDIISGGWEPVKEE